MENEGTRRKRILVVDDDEVMRELLPVLLGLGVYEVHLAASGEEALAWLATQPAPELIMTDLQMPGLEGEALISALRASTPGETLFLGMSASQPSELVLRSLDGFVSKPFDSEQVAQSIRQIRAARAGASHSAPSSNDAGTGANAADSAEDIPVLDEAIFSALAKRFKPEHLVEFYSLTLDDVGERHKRIEGYIAAGDLDAVHREAHSIKGSCGMVGARELQHLAAAAEGGTTLNTSAIADFPAACLRLRRILDAKFQS